jgi:hypothetical protein
VFRGTRLGEICNQKVAGSIPAGPIGVSPAFGPHSKVRSGRRTWSPDDPHVANALARDAGRQSMKAFARIAAAGRSRSSGRRSRLLPTARASACCRADEIFDTFTALYERGRPLLLTCDRSAPSPQRPGPMVKVRPGDLVS